MRKVRENARQAAVRYVVTHRALDHRHRAERVDLIRVLRVALTGD